jgi:hypothetical protein
MRLPALSLAGDVRSARFGRQHGFFEAQPLRTEEGKTLRRSLLMPRASSSYVRPRVVNGLQPQRSRNQSAVSPDSHGFLCPPILPWSSEPVWALSLRHWLPVSS